MLSSITTSTTMRHLYKPLLSSDSHAAATCSITLNNYFSTLLVSVDLQICLWCLIYLLLLSSDLHISNKLSFAFLTLVLVLVEQVLKKYHYISPTLLLQLQTNQVLLLLLWRSCFYYHVFIKISCPLKIQTKTLYKNTKVHTSTS